MKAIVNFRSLPNGAFRYMKGLRRGYYRVLIVKDENGSKHYNSHNVVKVLREFGEGLLGTTERSAYYIDDSAAEALADWWNNEQRLLQREQMALVDDGMGVGR